MLTIRFIRTGKTNQPFFRVVVTDKRNPPRAGRFVEIVGFFNPKTKEHQLKAERIKYWLGVGAQPSDTVHNLLVKDGVIEGKKKPVHKKPKKTAEEAKVTPVAKPVEAKIAEEAPAEPKPEA
jgi:small subunit ribosomal protein S16